MRTLRRASATAARESVIPKPPAAMAASAVAALPIWCAPASAGSGRSLQANGAEFEVPAIALSARAIVLSRQPPACAPISSMTFHTDAGSDALPSTAGRPARKIPAFSRPICSTESPSQST